MSRQLQEEDYVRAFRDLMLGVPALIVAVIIVTIAVSYGFTSETQLVERYTSEARRSYQAREYQRAKECYQKLWILSGGSREIRYFLAMCDFGLGNTDAAIAALTRLAPLDGDGYAPAHVWWAQRYFSFPQDQSKQEQMLVEQHLTQALKAEPDNVEAHSLLGGLYLATSRPALAEQHLQVAVQKLPLLRLPLAQAYVANGKPELARIQAEMAQKYLAKQSEIDPNNHTTRFQRAQVCLFLKDFAGAAAILREGFAASGAAAFRLALGQVHADWLDAIETSVALEKEESLRLLSEGLSYDTGNVPLIRRLVATSTAKNGISEKAQAVLNRMLAEGNSVATIHLFLAMDAHRAGDLSEARRNYEEVYRREPQVAVAINNLAWLLAHSEPVELDRALQLINQAIKQWPNQPDFRDTRGHILAKMKRWSEARTDLEAVVKVRPTANLHSTLAEICDELGLDADADEHRRIAQQLPRQEDANSPR